MQYHLWAVIVILGMVACAAGQALAEEGSQLSCEELEALRAKLLTQGADHWGDLVLDFGETAAAMELCGLKTNRLRTRLRSFKAKMERQSWWDANTNLDKEDVERRYEALQRLANDSI